MDGFLSALDAILKYHTNTPDNQWSYTGKISLSLTLSHDLQKTSPNYKLVFKPIHNCYADPLISFINSTNILLVQIPIC